MSEIYSESYLMTKSKKTLVEYIKQMNSKAEAIGITEDGEYIQYNGCLYKKMTEKIKEQK